MTLSLPSIIYISSLTLKARNKFMRNFHFKYFGVNPLGFYFSRHSVDIIAKREVE